MYRLKGIKLYFLSVLKLPFLVFKNYYLRSLFYNRKLVTYIPSRIFYTPSSFLCESLTSIKNDFYKISNTSPASLWRISSKDKLKFDNLHNFLWLTKLDRKHSKIFIKDIISSWINNFSNYDPDTWKMEITSKRIIAWSSNSDIILQDADKIYKEKLFSSLIKQSNFLIKNLSYVPHDSTKIICCTAIILSGIIFSENDLNYKIGIKELEKIIINYFDESGFPKSRNPEEVFICIKYLILIRECLKEAQKFVPNFLDEIILRIGNCYSFLSCSNKQFPLFNGATEINYKYYDIFLKNLKYKFNNKSYRIADLIKIKKKKLELFMDCGNPPTDNFARYYQAGCLAIELFSGKHKIISNSGYGKYLSSKFESLSRSTAAHSTLYMNDTSSCIFQKNNIVNEIYGNLLMEKLRVVNKSYTENKNSYLLSASHNGYKKKFGYAHTRSIKIMKREDKIFGTDELTKTRNYSNPVTFSVRFHIYPDNKIVKTKAGNSVLINLTNGEGWMLHCSTHNFEIEKNIFFGNKSKIINNESVSISSNSNEKKISVNWSIERIA